MENEFDTGDLFTNKENHREKTPPGEFKVTTSENPLLSNTSKVRFVKGYANYIKICPLQSPHFGNLWQNHKSTLNVIEYILL